MSPSLPRPDLTKPVHLLAFGLGSGLAKKAPGTFGSLAALPFWWLFLSNVPPLAYMSVLVSGFAFGVLICDKTSKDLGVHDHSGIVWDEWIGMWLTLLLIPSGLGLWSDLAWVAVAFGLFRFFDIIKPWPIRWLDRHIGGGFGIMIDDIIAGLFALLCVQLLAIWLV